MSALRARCPDCRTLTAVAIGSEYQCHSCGREFAAGLLRVPRAWGAGGEAMTEAAMLELPWPEAAVVAEDTLDAQIAARLSLSVHCIRTRITRARRDLRRIIELPDRDLMRAHGGAVALPSAR